MEIVTEIGQSQFLVYVPIALAILGAVLVFTFGFNKTQQPKFISLDDRKTAGKKKKIKEKKSTANGHVASAVTKSPSKDKKSPAKETADLKKKEVKPDQPKEIKPKAKESEKVVKPVAELKKKVSKKVNEEKPSDFDTGDWEKVPSKAEKKKKAEQSPAKKEKNADKKIKKLDKAEAEALIKEAIEKQLKENEKEASYSPEVAVEAVETPAEPEVPKKSEKKVEPVIEETVPVVEEKKEKKKEEKKKEKKQKKEKAAPVDPVEELAKEIQNKQEVPKEKVIEVAVKGPEEVHPQNIASGAVFDELGDAWTDAKAPKKSKKKTRRDN